MANNYVLPQVQVFQQFTLLPTALTAPLRALIIGGHAYLLRYAQATEKPLGWLGAYDPTDGVSVPIPDRPPGGILDPTYTKVFLDNARLEYYDDLIGVGSTVIPVSSVPNQIQSTNSSGGFKINGTNPRYALLYDRDVQVGDRVNVSGISSSVLYTIDTYIQGIASTGSDRVAATIGSPAAAASNIATQTSSSTVTPGQTSNNSMSANVAGYDGYTDGFVDDTYTITVLQGSTGGNFTTALVTWTTASGKDQSTAPVAPAAATTLFGVGNRGLQVSFSHTTGTPDLVPGQFWTVSVTGAVIESAPTAAGTYGGATGTTYIISVTRGGLFTDPAPPQVSVMTTTGVDASGPTTVSSHSTAYAIGTQGVTMTFAGSSVVGLRLGDAWYVTVTPQTDGAFRTLTLGRNLPPQLLSASDLNLRLSIQSNIQVTEDRIGFAPLVNWTVASDSTSINVASGLIAYDPTFTNAGVPMPINVTSGDLYLEYRAWRPDLSTAINGLSDASQLGTSTSVIAGALDPDNPLSWGVYKALANSNGTEVEFISVANPTDIGSWAASLAVLVGDVSLYNIVPLTFDRSIQDLVAAHVSDQSSAIEDRWRGAFVALQANPTKAAASAANSTDGNPILATFTLDPDALTTMYTIVTVPSANADFLTNGVLPGDIVRAQFSTSFGTAIYNEYVVDSVITEDSLRLVTGPSAAFPVPAMIEVWHNLNKVEQATDIGAQAGSFGTSRICAVWPDTVGSAGTMMPGYFLGCALAGLVSGVVPHQGLTNVEIQGFDDLTRTTRYFNGDQLDIMAGAGTWIVTQTPNGTVITRHAVTTDPTSINTREEMVRRNVDSISYFFYNRLAPYIGVANITPSSIDRIYTELQSAINYLKQASFTDLLGAQLVDAVIVSVKQDALLADRLNIIIDLILPYPLNNIIMNLVI